MYYQNTRGLHWNIKGEKNFELHLKFEELHTNLILKVDEIAERILTLGGTLICIFDYYQKTTQLKNIKNISDGNTGT